MPTNIWHTRRALTTLALLVLAGATAEVSLTIRVTAWPEVIPVIVCEWHASLVACSSFSAQDEQEIVALEKTSRSTYDIVYSACGTARKSEFLLSLKSLQLMALSTPASENALYRVHIITGVLQIRAAWATCFTAHCHCRVLRLCMIQAGMSIDMFAPKCVPLAAVHKAALQMQSSV